MLIKDTKKGKSPKGWWLPAGGFHKLKTNKQRQVSYDKQLRRAEAKSKKLTNKSQPAKLSSPIQPKAPLGLRTIRPLEWGSEA